jgi:hypothetical protein
MEGMEAHLTVLARDISSIPPDQISKAGAIHESPLQQK